MKQIVQIIACALAPTALLLSSGCASLSLPQKLVSPESATRDGAYIRLQSMPPNQQADMIYKEGAEDLCQYLSAADPETQFRAKAAVERITEPAANRMISCVFYNSNLESSTLQLRHVRDGFISLLVRCGSRAIDPLISALSKGDDPVRDIFIHALDELGPLSKPAITELAKYITDIHSPAYEVLMKQGANNVEVLGILLNGKNSQVQEAAFQRLSEIGSSKLARFPDVLKRYGEIQAERLHAMNERISAAREAERERKEAQKKEERSRKVYIGKISGFEIPGWALEKNLPVEGFAVNIGVGRDPETGDMASRTICTMPNKLTKDCACPAGKRQRLRGIGAGLFGRGLYSNSEQRNFICQ